MKKRESNSNLILVLAILAILLIQNGNLTGEFWFLPKPPSVNFEEEIQQPTTPEPVQPYITPYGADGTPYVPRGPATVTPYGADGTPYVPRGPATVTPYGADGTPYVPPNSLPLMEPGANDIVDVPLPKGYEDEPYSIDQGPLVPFYQPGVGVTYLPKNLIVPIDVIPGVEPIPEQSILPKIMAPKVTVPISPQPAVAPEPINPSPSIASGLGLNLAGSSAEAPIAPKSPAPPRPPVIVPKQQTWFEKLFGEFKFKR